MAEVILEGVTKIYPPDIKAVDDIDLDVIGNSTPRSICGSGLIDAVAVLLELGIVEFTGRFASRDDLADKVPQAILDRLVEKDDQPAFVLAGRKVGSKIRKKKFLVEWSEIHLYILHYHRLVVFIEYEGKDLNLGGRNSRFLVDCHPG